MEELLMKKVIGVIFSVLILGYIASNYSNIELFNKFTRSDAKIMAGKLILVNKENILKQDYVPGDLVRVKVKFYPKVTRQEKKMRSQAARALEDLFLQGEKEGVELYGLSGYRSYTSQMDTFEGSEDKNGKKYAEQHVAKPGESEHQTGLAMDVTNSKHSFPYSEEARWLANNAYKYGFIIRYPKEKEDITGYSYEPWHIRYVGTDASEEINSKGIVLEEYLKENEN